jgi:hypothetical protein
VLNLSTGSDRSKTRWNPTEIMYSDGVEVAPGLVSAQISRAYDFIRDQMHPASPTRMTLAKIRSTIGNSGKESKAQARVGTGLRDGVSEDGVVGKIDVRD